MRRYVPRPLHGSGGLTRRSPLNLVEALFQAFVVGAQDIALRHPAADGLLIRGQHRQPRPLLMDEQPQSPL